MSTRKDPMAEVVVGIVITFLVITAPLWGPFWIIGHFSMKAGVSRDR